MTTSFDITTTEKRSNWVYVASSKCNDLQIDTREVSEFVINGKRFGFTFDSDLMISGIVRKDWR